jgi:hypothetical protein
MRRVKVEENGLLSNTNPPKYFDTLIPTLTAAQYEYFDTHILILRTA